MTTAPHERTRRRSAAPTRARGAARAGARVLAVLLVLLLAAAAGGCGLSTNDEPETIKDNVPPDLLDSEAATPEVAPGETETVKVWFLDTDDQGETRLVARERLVPRPATQVSVLESLIQDPPNDVERTLGMSTDIPDDVTLTDQPRQRTDGVLIVNLSDDFYDLQGETARNAFAQIVYTATELPGVGKVQFERDGEVFNAVDGEGQSRSDPLSRDSYRNLAPPQGDQI
jgi:spore germination protein GerM